MDNVNKKIKGTREREYAGIIFKSQLEYYCYKKLEEAGFDNFGYELIKFVLWEGEKLSNILVYAPKKLGIGRYGKDLLQQTRALLNITYTPDFVLFYKDYIIYFDVKGKENDTYAIKKKMFLKKLEEDSKETNNKYIFFEPHSVKQMVQAIDIIKKL